MVSTSSCQDFSNFSTPSRSSTSSTSSKSMPTAARPSKTCCASPACHRVALHLAVVGERLEGLLGHRVDGVGDDQVGDVLGVGVALVLHAGGGPQRSLGVRAGVLQGLP